MTATISTGVHVGMTREEYDTIPGLSSSGMKDLAISPLRYWYHWINPAEKPEDEEETKSQRMGTALHCAVLESPEVFDARYARELDPSDWPVCLDTIQEIRDWVASKGGKAAGNRKEDVIASALAHMQKIGEHVPILAEEQRRFFAANEGKTILRVDEWERIVGMARALFDEPRLTKMLAEGKPEVALTATDPETGVPLKCRLDWLAPRHTVDLKTFTQMRGKSIDKSIHDAIYYDRHWVQAFFNDYVRRLATGADHGSFDTVYAFVESDQPHETRLKAMLPKTGGEVNLYWERARIEVRSMIRLYAQCLDKYGDAPWRSRQEVEPLTDNDVSQFAWS